MIESRPMLPVGYRLVRYESIGSTNDEAKRLARNEAADGTVVWALEQTAGRGRRGNAWVSPPGNLYASVILRPDRPASRATQIGFAAALALGDGLTTLLPGLDKLSYKWPNDVLINGRKVAGILLESEMTAPEKLAFLVVGVGVNLNHSPKGTEFPATSLFEEGFGTNSADLLLEAFVCHLQAWKARWLSDGFAPLRAAWLAAAAVLPGEPIGVRLDAVTLTGNFIDLSEQGALVLEAAGERRHVSVGQVFPVNR